MIGRAYDDDAALEAEDALTQGVLSRRILAFILDGVLVAAVCAVLWVVLLTFGVLTLGIGMPLLGLLPLVPLLYNWLFVASPLSATPGQRLMGLTVRRNRDLAPPTPLEALVWTVGFLVTFSLGIVWFAAALITLRHRTLHDLVSGLVVVRIRALTQPAPIWNPPAGGASYV
jgi:uncharacterized RDD family membrane protein YckC